MNEAKNPLEVVWGAKAIGDVIGRDERQTYHMLETGLLKCSIRGDSTGRGRRLSPRR
jgi:hypothetical protein